jgi:hypothetical protein
MPRSASRPGTLLKLAVIPLAALLGGCVLETLALPAAGVSGASLIFTAKTPLDHVAGLATRQDCSSVRWERHGPWCVPPAPPPLPTAFCTRSLGAVDCWDSPPELGGLREVADPGR